MTHQPSAASLLRAGLAPMLDATAVMLLVVLGWQVLLGGSRPFESDALWVGLIGALACWMAPGAARNLPIPMLVYVGVALLSSAVHQWAAVASTSEPDWLALFVPAFHLVTMAVFVFGAAHSLRTPPRLSLFVVLLVVSTSILAVQVLFDRVSSNFVYARGGSVSLPSVAQWGGLHQTGILLVLALPFTLSLVLFGRSLWRIMAGLLLGGALLLVALVNGSTGGIVAMVFAGVMMAACGVLRSVRGVWHRVFLAAAVVTLLMGFFLAVSSGQVRLVAHGDLAGRVPVWRAAAAIWRDHFWLGAGPGGYTTAMLDGGYATLYLPQESMWFGVAQAHNMMLHVAAETGVTGMLCVAALWLWMFRACWQAWAKGYVPLVAFGLLFALAGFFMRSMSDNFLDGLVTTDRTRVLIWMLFAAALAVGRLPRRAARVER